MIFNCCSKWIQSLTLGVITLFRFMGSSGEYVSLHFLGLEFPGQGTSLHISSPGAKGFGLATFLFGMGGRGESKGCSAPLILAGAARGQKWFIAGVNVGINYHSWKGWCEHYKVNFQALHQFVLIVILMNPLKCCPKWRKEKKKPCGQNQLCCSLRMAQSHLVHCHKIVSKKTLENILKQ